MHTKIQVVNTIRNLRYRWPEELKPFTDGQIFRAYDDFARTEDFGNNDEKFPEWFGEIGKYNPDPIPFKEYELPTSEVPDLSPGLEASLDELVADIMRVHNCTERAAIQAIRNATSIGDELKRNFKS
jgi:hypothetical protein